MSTKIKRILDVLIQIFIIIGFLYAAFEILVVFKNPQGGLVLLQNALTIDPQIFLARRLYALEFWIILTNYFVYLGLRKRIWSFDSTI